MPMFVLIKLKDGRGVIHEIEQMNVSKVYCECCFYVLYKKWNDTTYKYPIDKILELIEKKCPKGDSCPDCSTGNCDQKLYVEPEIKDDDPVELCFVLEDDEEEDTYKKSDNLKK